MARKANPIVFNPKSGQGTEDFDFPSETVWRPNDHGMIGWTTDPAIAGPTSAAVPTAGRLFIAAIKLRKPETINNIFYYLTTAGTTLTSGQCFLGLYQNGVLIGTTADQSGNFVGTAGIRQATLLAPAQADAGLVYVGLIFNGTTGPSLVRSGSGSGLTNVNLAGPVSRYGGGGSGFTTALPATLPTITNDNNNYWYGIS